MTELNGHPPIRVKNCKAHSFYLEVDSTNWRWGYKFMFLVGCFAPAGGGVAGRLQVKVECAGWLERRSGVEHCVRSAGKLLGLLGKRRCQSASGARILPTLWVCRLLHRLQPLPARRHRDAAQGQQDAGVQASGPGNRRARRVPAQRLQQGELWQAVGLCGVTWSCWFVCRCPASSCSATSTRQVVAGGWLVCRCPELPACSFLLWEDVSIGCAINCSQSARGVCGPAMVATFPSSPFSACRQTICLPPLLVLPAAGALAAAARGLPGAGCLPGVHSTSFCLLK